MVKISVEVALKVKTGATPAAMLVQIASRYESRIHLEAADGVLRVNAKSIMGMMSLDLTPGKTVLIEAEGADEEAAVEAIKGYLLGNA